MFTVTNYRPVPLDSRRAWESLADQLTVAGELACLPPPPSPPTLPQSGPGTVDSDSCPGRVAYVTLTAVAAVG